LIVIKSIYSKCYDTLEWLTTTCLAGGLLVLLLMGAVSILQLSAAAAAGCNALAQTQQEWQLVARLCQRIPS
jgi:hypothetical protein